MDVETFLSNHTYEKFEFPELTYVKNTIVESAKVGPESMFVATLMNIRIDKDFTYIGSATEYYSFGTSERSKISSPIIKTIMTNVDSIHTRHMYYPEFKKLIDEARKKYGVVFAGDKYEEKINRSELYDLLGMEDINGTI